MRWRRETLSLCVLLAVLAAGQRGLCGTRYESTDVPKAIAKTGTTTSTLEIDEAGPIDNVDVELDITFIWDEDLDVYLVAPDGTRVELFTDVGGMGMDFTQTVLDDDAPTAIQDGTAPFTGTYRPEGQLRDLEGKDGQGTWKLEVTNDGGWFDGRLNSWALVLGDVGDDDNGTGQCPALPKPVNPEPADGATGVPVDVTLAWRGGAGAPTPFRLLAATGEETGGPSGLYELQTDPVGAVHLGDHCGVAALDVSPDGELYGCDAYALWKLAVTEDSVSCSRIGAFHSTTDESILMTGLAFHPDGTLYGSTFNISTSLIGSDSILYRIDEETAFVTEVCRFSILQGIPWAIDFSPDGRLYGAFTTLMLIDLDACEAVALADVIATDIDWAPDGFIYATDDEAQMLYKMDPSLAIIADEFGTYDIAAWGLASQALDGTAQAGGGATGLPTPLQSAKARDPRTLEADLERLRDRLSRLATRATGPNAKSYSVAGQAILLAAMPNEQDRITYDVYMDTAAPPTTLVCSDVDAQECDPSAALAFCTTYHWQVVAKNACGDTAAGPVWSFTTESVPADFDKDCDVDFSDLAVFASYWLFAAP